MADTTLPSGAKLTFRGLKGKELAIFQDKKALRDGTLPDKILKVCTECVDDPGPYRWEDVPRWDEALVGDKFYAFLKVRIETYGNEFEFPIQCRECGKSFEWTVKLDELPVKTLSEADRQAFVQGHPLHTTIPQDGRPVSFRLATGRDEKNAIKAKDDEDALIKLTALRIIELDGEKDRNKIQRELEELSLPSLMQLVKEFDKRDCGVETEIEVECPCGAVRKMNLPLDRGFLLPS